MKLTLRSAACELVLLDRVPSKPGVHGRLQIFAERNISYHVSTPALEWVVDHGGFDWELGARPLRGAIAKWLEIPVSEAILKGELKAGHVMEIELGDDELIYKTIVIVEEPTLKPDAIAPSL